MNWNATKPCPRCGKNMIQWPTATAGPTQYPWRWMCACGRSEYGPNVALSVPITEGSEYECWRRANQDGEHWQRVDQDGAPPSREQLLRDGLACKTEDAFKTWICGLTPDQQAAFHIALRRDVVRLVEAYRQVELALVAADEGVIEALRAFSADAEGKEGE